MVRRTLVGISLLVVAAALMVPGVSGATTHAKVGPRQIFDGSVNGSLGTPTPAIIEVVCPGPSTVGRTAHPLPGQTVEVRLAPSAAARSGRTGDHATSIGAFFGPPPPGATGPGEVSFARYGVPKAIPTSLTFPCRGTGVVTFIPFPNNPATFRSASVPVEYADVAAGSAG